MVSTKGSKPKEAPVDVDRRAYKTYFVVKNKLKPNSYLRFDVYRAMKDDQKWGPIERADKFLSSESAMAFANRIVGSDFEIVERDLPTTRDEGAFCLLPPK
jgi:hypothetical protein